MLSFDSNGLCVSAGELRHFIKDIIFLIFLNPSAMSTLCISHCIDKRLQWMNSTQESSRTNENEWKNKPKRLNHERALQWTNSWKKSWEISYGWLIILTTNKWICTFFVWIFYFLPFHKAQGEMKMKFTERGGQVCWIN